MVVWCGWGVFRAGGANRGTDTICGPADRRRGRPRQIGGQTRYLAELHFYRAWNGSLFGALPGALPQDDIEWTFGPYCHCSVTKAPKAESVAAWANARRQSAPHCLSAARHRGIPATRTMHTPGSFGCGCAALRNARANLSDGQIPGLINPVQRTCGFTYQLPRTLDMTVFGMRLANTESQGVTIR